MASHSVKADVTGKVWKVLAAVGDTVAEDQEILIVESMKMEIPVAAPCGGRLAQLFVGEGDDVAEGQEVAVVER